MHVLYTNADCLLNKLSELKVIASSNRYQVICITESDLNDDILNAEIQIPSFGKMYLANRKFGVKGGSIVYVHDSVTSEQLDILGGSESLAIKLTIGTINFILVYLYRSPSLTVQQNNELLEQLKLLPDDPTQNVIMVGDVNLPDVDWHLGTVLAPAGTTNVKLVNQQKYMDFFIEKGLMWYIKDKIRNSQQFLKAVY